MANNEITNCERFIYGRLSTHAPLLAVVSDRIYPDPAPAGTNYPFVIIRFSATERDILAVGNERKAIPLRFLVFGSAKSPNWAGPIETISTEIDAALSGKQGNAGDGYVYTCQRREPWRDWEYTGGVYYRSMGWYFRILVTAAPIA